MSDARALASPNLVVVLVGNKLDREEEREVGYEEASEWAREHGEYCCSLRLKMRGSFLCGPKARYSSRRPL